MIFTLLVVLTIFWLILDGILVKEESLTDPPPQVMALVMFFVLFIIASFSSLTVTIHESFLNIKFGYGIFRKKFVLKDIASTKIVKNKWYFGWGIRFWFWPRMTIFNVSGFDAVELKMKDGKIFRIGTDEPEDLNRHLAEILNRR